jgi:hypothetical protein
LKSYSPQGRKVNRIARSVEQHTPRVNQTLFIKIMHLPAKAVPQSVAFVAGFVFELFNGVNT